MCEDSAVIVGSGWTPIRVEITRHHTRESGKSVSEGFRNTVEWYREVGSRVPQRGRTSRSDAPGKALAQQ